MRLARAGIPVPPGIVLPVPFFHSWMEAVRATPAWRDFAAGDFRACAALKAVPLAFDDAQRAALELDGALFAVRSSSPEEDLEGASFAGMYETVLGVPRDGLEAAVRRAFVSCLDARVALYKRGLGRDFRDPRIAVVVQRQLASDAAGVAFSLHPVTNDFDEMVINANWGLGETVVAGRASPDQITVDKAAMRVVERRAGAKETSLWLTASGGTEERADPRRAQLSLSDAHALELAGHVSRIEALYGAPVDVEWAVSGGRLCLLQARPITTHFALPADLQTAPGAPRRLYFDVTTSVQGLPEPMSPMATSMFAGLIGRLMRDVFGRDISADPATAGPFARHGRILVNLSNLLPMWTSLPAKLALVDPVAGRAVAAVGRAYHAPDGGFRRHRWRLAGAAVRVLGRLLPVLMAPERAARARRLETEAFLRRGAGLPETVRFVIRRLAPAVGAGRIAASVAARLAGTPLDRGLPGNVTVEMGLELARLARRVPAAWTADELDARLARREAPADLQAAWDAWIERYGHRGPREIDPAAPRYREEPGLVLRQLVALRDAPPTGDPAAQREAAYAAARARLGPLQRIALDAAYRVLVALGGFRELPKFALVRAIDGVRRRAIAEGRAFGEALRKPWPRLFDSRGRIVRPPPLRAREGELAGEGVSPGVARGPVKVLHAPDEKPVAPGDVLVARATDPGWTPLFVNAAAVVLEIGGSLQHGALVAREYGKPCVVGIERATERLADGAIVEVDGAAGIVRRR